MTDTFSVSALNGYIKQRLERDVSLADIWVAGEVSNLRKQTSGHIYFTLKDPESEVRAVIWKSQAQLLRYLPENGAQVRLHGRMSVYVNGGYYQITCDQIQPAGGMGDLHVRLRQLWAKLESEGLMRPEIKRPLPPFPQKIGVVTSQTTAAFQDVCNVLRRRYPLAEIYLSHTPVQGEAAPPQIIAALQRADAFGVDVILMVRGGGSAEDLNCFNDEALARAVRETRAPVVTGIGHEIDTTLVDGTSDRRAPTPSAAAELITPSLDNLETWLNNSAARLNYAWEANFTAMQDNLNTAAHKLRLLSPVGPIHGSMQRVDDLSARLERAIAAKISAARQALTSSARALELANPTNLLGRGYALVTRALDGKRLTSAREAAPGTSIHIQLAHGRLTASVRERMVGDDE